MKMRKAISIVLSCLILMSCLSVNVFAVSDTLADADKDLSINGDGSIIASLDSTTRTLTIKGTGAIKDFSSSTYAPFDHNKYYIYHVIVEEGITRIGNYTFQGCDMDDISLPSTLESIGKKAFAASDLTSLEIPANVTIIEEHGVDGTKIESLSFAPNSKLEIIGNYAFDGSKFKSLDIPNGVREIGEFAFSGCKQLTEVTLPSSIKIIGRNAFEACGLSSVVIPEGVTSIGHRAFNNCPNLKSAVIPSSITTLNRDVFNGCTNLETVVIPEGITSIGEYTFANCSSLTSITIPSSVKSVGYRAFYNCSNLSLITNLANSNQSIDSVSFKNISSNPTVYLYGANTSMIAATANMTTPTINYLDDPILSGVLDNGVKWTYDPSTSTITFEGSGDIPSYTNGTQPWYGALQHYGGANDWLFGEGISGIGSGTFVGGGVGGSGLNVWAPSSLGSSISSQLPNANVGDIQDHPSNDTKPKTGIWNFVDDVEVAFPDEQPRIINGEIVSPLRFIFQDLGATVLWNHEKQTAIVRKEENGNKVEIVLTPGSSSMIVNGKEYSNTEIGLDATVFLENGRCFLPGRAIIKAWETVQFKAVHNEPTSYEDYYYKQATPVEGGDDKLQDIPVISEWQEEGVVITPENEQEVINGGSTETPTTSSTSSMDIIMDIEPTQFKVTVPIAVSVSMSANGVISVGSGYAVYNRCPMGPVIIKNIKVVPLTSWGIADFNADFKEMKASTKQFGMSINGIEVPSNGVVPLSGSLSTNIKCRESKGLDFKIKLSAQKETINKLAMAAVVFTVDFDKI